MKSQTKPSFKKICYSILFVFAVSILFYRCSSENDKTPNSSDFSNLKEDVLNSITQNFHFNANSGNLSFTTAQGVVISFNSNDLTLGGNTVSGMIDLKYVEIFTDGTMAATGMHTMGLMPDGKHAVMNSGESFTSI